MHTIEKFILNLEKVKQLGIMDAALVDVEIEKAKQALKGNWNGLKSIPVLGMNVRFRNKTTLC